MIKSGENDISSMMVKEEKEELISVIVPVYNSSDTIIRCVDSILGQTYGKKEVIIVDDGSSDNTYEICISRYGKNDKVKLLRHDHNQGVSIARNDALNVAKGMYVSFCDSDDFMEPDMLSKMFQTAKKHDADIVSCGIYGIGQKIQTDIVYMDKEEMVRSVLKYGGFVWNKLFRKKNIENVRFDPELSFCEDYLFLLSCIVSANKMVSISQNLYHYAAGGVTHGASNRHFQSGRFGYEVALEKAGELMGEKWVDAFRHKCYILAVVEKDSDYQEKELNEENKLILEQVIRRNRQRFIMDKEISIREKIIYTLRDRIPQLKAIVLMIRKLAIGVKI